MEELEDLEAQIDYIPDWEGFPENIEILSSCVFEDEKTQEFGRKIVLEFKWKTNKDAKNVPSAFGGTEINTLKSTTPERITAYRKCVLEKPKESEMGIQPKKDKIYKNRFIVVGR